MELATIDYSKRETLDLIKNTVAQGTKDDEFALFVEQCKATGLNPFKKEIWCIVTSPDKPLYRKVQLMTGVNGFYAIANNNPNYDGMKINYGNIVDVKVDTNQEGVKTIKAPEWVECEVYRKDRKYPQVFRAYWHEYAKDLVSKGYNGSIGKLTIWAKLSSTMLSKCAESMALRKAFPQELNGFYTQEEMPSDFSVPRQEIKVSENAGSYPTVDRKTNKAQKTEEFRKTTLDEDEIPSFEKKEEVEQEEIVIEYNFLYGVGEILKDAKREANFQEYLKKLDDSKVDYHLEDDKLYSQSELVKLKDLRLL